MTSMINVEELARACDVFLTTWAPGDGVRRYRVHAVGAPVDYHADPHPLYTALGRKDLLTWLSGWRAHQLYVRENLERGAWAHTGR